MATSATITSKYQLTLPREVRERLGVERGDRLVFEIHGEGEVLIRKARSEDRAWLALAEGAFAEWDNPDDAVYDDL
ncbi:MAG TPA: AbrB/MazE/SpoVT family DNA-binding domain-containing protein [bacterium]|jgi:AbrB family looped-hinge helix DNA binding protein